MDLLTDRPTDQPTDNYPHPFLLARLLPRTAYLEGAIASTTASATPQEQVDSLIQVGKREGRNAG